MRVSVGYVAGLAHYTFYPADNDGNASCDEAYWHPGGISNKWAATAHIDTVDNRLFKGSIMYKNYSVADPARVRDDGIDDGESTCRCGCCNEGMQGHPCGCVVEPHPNLVIRCVNIACCLKDNSTMPTTWMSSRGGGPTVAEISHLAENFGIPPRDLRAHTGYMLCWQPKRHYAFTMDLRNGRMFRQNVFALMCARARTANTLFLPWEIWEKIIGALYWEDD